MPVPDGYELVSAQSEEYQFILANIPQPEVFVYDPAWGAEVNGFDGFEPYSNYYYIHMPSCILYRKPKKVKA